MEQTDYYFNTTIENVKPHFLSGIRKIVGYKEETEEIWFYCKDGYVVKMYHDQDCCEYVYLQDDDGLTNGEDIFTDCDWLEVEEVVECDNGKPLCEYDVSYTWTFYKFKSNKGYDTMRWYGSSNGYYSESVDFEIYKENGNEA